EGSHVSSVAAIDGIVAGATGDGVVAVAAREIIGAGIADEDVAEGVAGGIDVGRAGQRQVLKVGAEGVADRTLDRVVAGVGVLGDDVTGVVDDVGGVAEAADQLVGACATVENVVAGIAGERVGEAVAGGVDVRRAGQGEALDVVGEGIGGRAQHGVGAAVGG